MTTLIINCLVPWMALFPCFRWSFAVGKTPIPKIGMEADFRENRLYGLLICWRALYAKIYILYGGCYEKGFLAGNVMRGSLLAAACKSTTVTTVPLLYTNNESTEFEILGEVLYESKDRAGYIGLLKAARDLYPDCDYVIDIMAEQRITRTTTAFFGRRNSVDTDVTWVMRGTAIKYKR